MDTAQGHHSGRIDSLRTLKWQPVCIALLAIGGGTVMMVGTLLPWVSLFAGLQTYSGIAAWNGRLLFAGGALSVVAGIGFFFLDDIKLRWGLGLFGFVLLAFASWLLLQLLKTVGQLSPDTMTFARIGPGLFAVTIGAVSVFATLFVNHTRTDKLRRTASR